MSTRQPTDWERCLLDLFGDIAQVEDQAALAAQLATGVSGPGRTNTSISTCRTWPQRSRTTWVSPSTRGTATMTECPVFVLLHSVSRTGQVGSIERYRADG